MTVIKQMKGLWGVMGSIRNITNVMGLAPKSVREAVSVGLPSWDPPGPEWPPERDQATVDRVSEVIGMGTVEERKMYDRVITSWRKITTGAPQQPPPEEERPALPAPRPAAGEQEKHG